MRIILLYRVASAKANRQTGLHTMTRTFAGYQTLALVAYFAESVCLADRRRFRAVVVGRVCPLRRSAMNSITRKILGSSFRSAGTRTNELFVDVVPAAWEYQKHKESLFVRDLPRVLRDRQEADRPKRGGSSCRRLSAKSSECPLPSEAAAGLRLCFSQWGQRLKLRNSILKATGGV